MSQKLGFEHEGAVKNAFAAILRTEGKHHGYTLIEEYPFRKSGRQLSIDGALIDDFKLALGNRSALDWIIDQYRVKTDSRSGITSDPNNDDDPDYIVRLIKKIITVSVETVKIVDTLPKI